MPINNIDLFTENGEEIVGVKLLNGNTGKIKFTVDSKTAHQDCVLPQGIMEDKDGLCTFLLHTGEEIKNSIKSVCDYSFNRWMGI